MKLELIKSDDKRLKEVSKEVLDFTKDYKSIIESIKEVCLEKSAYAAAAPQFGLNERFILVMTDNKVCEMDEKIKKFVITSYFNPVITKMEGAQIYYEACMSVDNAIGRVKRPFRIKFRYQDIDGSKHVKTVEGFEAIIICHEIDHLDGIEYIDRADIIYYDVNVGQRKSIRERNPHEILSISEEFKYQSVRMIVKQYSDEN